MKCDLCKRIVELPFTCNYCGQHFCSDHRLPEQHLCPGLPEKSWSSRRSIVHSSEEILAAETEAEFNRLQRREARLESERLRQRTPAEILADEAKAESKRHPHLSLASDHKKTKKRTRSILGICFLLVIVGIACGAYVQYGQSMDGLGTHVRGFWEGAECKYREILGGIGEMFRNLIPEPEPEPLKPFTSVDDLIRFLDDDNVSDVVYASDFVCGDFARALENRAHDAGYDLEYHSMFGWELDSFKIYVKTLRYVRVVDGVETITTFSYGTSVIDPGYGHAVCKTEIGPESYLVEPQSDQVYRIVDSDWGYEIVHFGEVTKEG